jgi:hypothetical protein
VQFAARDKLPRSIARTRAAGISRSQEILTVTWCLYPLPFGVTRAVATDTSAAAYDLGLRRSAPTRHKTQEVYVG